MTSLLSKSTRKADVTFFQSGRIDITARVVKLLDLQPGDVIDIAVSGSEYLLYVRTKAANVVGRHAGEVRTTKYYSDSRYSLNFRAWHKQLCQHMREVCPGTGYPLYLPCGNPRQQDGRIVLPLITFNPL